MRVTACASLIAFTLAGAFGQSVTDRPAFEVASIKLNKSGPTPEGTERRPAGPAPGGQRFTATNMPLIALIVIGYGVSAGQVSGLPRSFDSEHYDIEAKADRPVTRERMMRMLQSLLEDRFKMNLRREVKELPIYALTVAKGGEKVQPSADGEQERGWTGSRGEFVYEGTSMLHLALILSGGADRIVLDRTGLKGDYDFTLEYARDRGARGVPDSDRPSIFTALQEQLGLKLEPQRGPVEFLIVEHVEKPTEN